MNVLKGLTWLVFWAVVIAIVAAMIATNYGCLLAGEKQSIASPQTVIEKPVAQVAAVASSRGDEEQKAIASTRPTQQSGTGNVSIGDRITTNDPKLIIAVVSICLGYVEWRAYRYGYKRNRRKRLAKEKK